MVGDAEEEQEWEWGRRLAAGGLRSRLQAPSPRGQSLEGQAAEGKGQPRGGEPPPVPRGAAAGLSTKVRLNRDMALVPQAAAAMGNAGPAQRFSSIDSSRSGRRGPEGRGGLSLPPTRRLDASGPAPGPASGPPPAPPTQSGATALRRSAPPPQAKARDPSTTSTFLPVFP